MKYILIYKNDCLWGYTYHKNEFKTIEEVEEFINKMTIKKDNVIYLGENKPLKYKIVLG